MRKISPELVGGFEPKSMNITIGSDFIASFGIQPEPFAFGCKIGKIKSLFGHVDRYTSWTNCQCFKLYVRPPDKSA